MAVFGFTGSVSDLTFARMQALMGPRVSVEGPTHWAPTVTGADRTVSFAAGNGYILGLRDERAGAFTLQQAANATGANRVDLFVMRANWTAKTITPTTITGSSPTVAPAITRTALTTGDVYDFPLCVAITPNGGGAYSAGAIRDIRAYGGLGHLEVPQPEFIAAHDLVPGQRWRVESNGMEYVVNPAGALVPYGRGIIGGRTITGTAALGGAIGGTETMPANMNSGTVSLLAGRRYRIHARYKVVGSTSNDDFILRIREGASGGSGGNQIREHVHRVTASAFGYTFDFFADYETGSSAVSKVFSVTAILVGGTGTLQFYGGDTGSANPVGVFVEDVGTAGLLTVTAS